MKNLWLDTYNYPKTRDCSKMNYCYKIIMAKINSQVSGSLLPLYYHYTTTIDKKQNSSSVNLINLLFFINSRGSSKNKRSVLKFHSLNQKNQVMIGDIVAKWRW